MASVTVKVEGLQQLGELMRGLAAEVNQKISHQAVLAGARVIKKRARELAPVAPEDYRVDDGSKSGMMVPKGNVRDNIVTARRSKTQYTSEYVVAVRGKRKHGFASRIGSLAEYGTVNQEPKSFMRAGFEQEKGFSVGKIKQTLTAGIDKAIKAKGKG